MSRMKAWIIYNINDYKRNKSFAQILYNKLLQYNVETKILFVEKIKFGVIDNKLVLYYENLPIELPDFAILRTIYPLLSRHLEIMGIDVYNNSLVAEICNDKSRTYQYIASLGINIVPSFFVKKDYLEYYNNNSLIKTGDVIKTVDGHGGKEVLLYSTEVELPYKDIVAQEFIKGKGQDLRVYILDNTILAAVLRTSKDGFKSNFSLGGTVELYNIDSVLEKNIKLIIDKFYNGSQTNCRTKGLIFAGIDFIIDSNGNMFFNEIEDVVGSRMLYNCSDINVGNMFIKCIMDKYN